MIKELATLIGLAFMFLFVIAIGKALIDKLNYFLQIKLKLYKYIYSEKEIKLAKKNGLIK